MINSLSLVQTHFEKKAKQQNPAAKQNSAASMLQANQGMSMQAANALKANSLMKFSFAGNHKEDPQMMKLNQAVEAKALKSLPNVDKALAPKSVVVIGASSKVNPKEGPKLGTIALSNILKGGFTGTTYALQRTGVAVINDKNEPIPYIHHEWVDGEAKEVKDQIIPIGHAVKLGEDGKFHPALQNETKGVLRVFDSVDKIEEDMKGRGLDKENKLGVLVASADDPAKVKSNISAFANKIKADGVAIIAAGFSEVKDSQDKEQAERGLNASKALKEAFVEAKETDMAVFGPNTIGVVNTDPNIKLNATFMAPSSKFGHDERTAFVSASGAMLVALGNEGLPAKHAISGGNGEVLRLGDIITNYKNDKDIDVVTSYMENLGNNVNELGKNLKEMAKSKTVIIHKSGRTEAAQAAAAAHTGAAASGYGAVELFLKENGVITSDKSRDLGVLTTAFQNLAKTDDGKPILPKGNKIAIVTNGGGAGSLMTDATEEESVVGKDGYLQMSTLDKDKTIPTLQGKQEVDATTMKALAEIGITTEDDNKISLPPDGAAFTNPNPSTLDTIADITPAEYLKAAGTLMKDKEVNGMMAYLVPLNKNFAKEKEIIKGLSALQKAHEKPVTAVIQGDDDTMKSLDKYIEDNKLNVAVYRTPEDADQAMSAYVKRAEWLKEQEAIEAAKSQENPLENINKNEAGSIIESARVKGLDKLDGQQAQEVLEAYGVRVCQSKAVPLAENKGQTIEKVVEAADKIMSETKAPVVLKIMSDDKEIGGHKSNIGGVVLNLNDKESVKKGVEQIYNKIIEPGEVKVKGHDGKDKTISTKGQIKGIQVQEMVKGESAQEIFVGTNVDEGSGIATMTVGEGGILVDHHQDSQVTMLLPEEGDPIKYKAEKLITMSPGGKRPNPVGGHFDPEHPIREGLPVGNKEKMVEQLARIAKFANDFKDQVESVNVNPFMIVKEGPKAGEVVCVDAKVAFKKQK